MKLKNKLILDGIILFLLIVLMDYSLTGGLLHELLGIVILAGFIIHVAVNRKYYGTIIKTIRSDKRNSKSRVSFAINIILPVIVLLMLISSLAVSKELFPGIAGLLSNDLWVPVHIFSAVALMIFVFVHVCMHAKIISSVIGRAAENTALMKVKNAGMRVMAVIFALLVAKSSFSNMAYAASLLPSGDRNETEIDQSSNKQSNELIGDDSSDQDGYVIEIEPEPESDETVSLDDYLSSLFCNGCGRHCSLLSPQCGKGREQASQAEAEYYETNNGQNI